MCHFTGPGRLYLQSHKPPDLQAASSGNDGGRSVRPRRSRPASGCERLVGCAFLCFFLAAFFGVFGVAIYSFLQNGGEYTMNGRRYHHEGWSKKKESRRHLDASDGSFDGKKARSQRRREREYYDPPPEPHWEF